jgi:hypothetical protein
MFRTPPFQRSSKHLLSLSDELLLSRRKLLVQGVQEFVQSGRKVALGIEGRRGRVQLKADCRWHIRRG